MPFFSHKLYDTKRTFSWMPKMDGYILRAFLVPFFILLFAFTLLFIIMDVYTEISEFLDNKASVSIAFRYFMLKIPGNIRFILPITVLLSSMYALANLGRNRELTAIRASGISLVRCGLPIFMVGFSVMLVNFYFNEKLVPDTTRTANIIKKTLGNPNYVEQTNARLQFHSGDRLRSWYFGQFDDTGYQEKVKLKFFKFDPDFPKRRILVRSLEADKARYIANKGWEFFKAELHEYSEDGLPGDAVFPAEDPYFISADNLPDKPSVILKSVIQPDDLSSMEIRAILRDNPNMSANLRRIYSTIFYNRLAFPWACFLCAFFALPLATKNERSGIFTAIALAVGIAVAYQVLNEIFMVAGKNGYLPPVAAGLAPTALFALYGLYLLRKVG